MDALPFPQTEQALLAAYARWVGGQAATPGASRQQVRHAIGRFLRQSRLIAPHAKDTGVARLVRRAFVDGWRASLAGHPPAAPWLETASESEEA